MDTKVFCLGLPKTGTTSLERVLQSLGYTVTAWCGQEHYDLMDKGWDLAQPLLLQHNAFRDNPWCFMYREALAQFPDAKFILSTRDEQSWIESQVRHFGDLESVFFMWGYGVPYIKGYESKVVEAMHRHNQSVRETIPKGQLLEYNLTKDVDITNKIREFLGYPLVNIPFPVVNEKIGLNTFKRTRPKEPENGYIFVAMPCYKDPLVHKTLENMYNNASNPEKLVVSIFNQDDHPLVVDPRYNCKIVNVPLSEAKGVGNARYQTNKAYNREQWYLQIDSHMTFAKGWDETLIKQWRDYQNPFAVLSGALPNTNDALSNPSVGSIKGLVFRSKNEYGIPMLKLCDPKDAMPLVCGHFIFSSYRIMQVPQDPFIWFWGEESLFSMRLWSYGFNVYLPSKAVMGHFYDTKRSRSDKQNPNKYKDSYARIRDILYQDIYPFSYFGRVRDPKEFHRKYLTPILK